MTNRAVRRRGENAGVAARWNSVNNEKPVIDGVRRPNLSLADFVAPSESGADYVGMFAVNSLDMEQRIAQFEAAHDDYNSIMFKALADRLVEALPNTCTRKSVQSIGATHPMSN